eukprot:scaffold7595_cov107-Isochrysis_galbana.AAC.2
MYRVPCTMYHVHVSKYPAHSCPPRAPPRPELTTTMSRQPQCTIIVHIQSSSSRYRTGTRYSYARSIRRALNSTFCIDIYIYMDKIDDRYR